MYNLPAHLANRQVRALTERASEGMGSTLPPHISIQGNCFTFVDAAGNEYQPMLTFDAVIIDVSDAMCKRYYDKPFDPNASTYEPPACWSANGIAPSVEATKPQHATCEGCPQNDRGSAVSRISGAAIKACRDERWIAVMLPMMPQMVFQLVITPGSFKNWKAYTEMLRNYGVEMSLVKTRFSFVPKTNGVILFELGGDAQTMWIDAPTLAAVEASNAEKKTDAIVGRLDRPRTAALAAPVATQALPVPQQGAQAMPMPSMAGVAQQEIIPPGQPMPMMQMAPQQAPAPQQAAPLAMPPTAAPQPVQEAAQPAAAAPQRRRRRTAAEMAAAAPGAPQAAPQPQQMAMPMQAPVPQQMPMAAPQPTQAPFPVQPTQAPQSQFGMAPAAPINPEMAAMLAQMGMAPQK